MWGTQKGGEVRKLGWEFSHFSVSHVRLLKSDIQNQWKAVTFRPRGREMTWLHFMETGAIVLQFLVCMAELRWKEQRRQRWNLTVYFHQGTQMFCSKWDIRLFSPFNLHYEQRCPWLNVVLRYINVPIYKNHCQKWNKSKANTSDRFTNLFKVDVSIACCILKMD